MFTLSKCSRVLVLMIAPFVAVRAPALAQGSLANGANVTGFIASINQTDTWTFSANKGDDITVSVSEAGVNTSFVPEIHLIGPDATSYGYGWGDLSAMIHITSGSTGSYTLQVTRRDSTSNGGNYLLTLAKAPGTFVVSTGDEGGQMNNGQNYSGSMLRGDLDLWSFNATKGDDLTVSISEAGTNTAFVPDIHLIGPDGTNYGYGWGDLSAMIHITAGSTGSYTVVASRYDNADGVGNYLLTFMAAPETFSVSSGDEGGSLPDGQSYSGTLVRGDLDPWSFTANKGDDITVSISESGTNTAFVPEIHLIGPDGTNYGYGWGDLSAQIHITGGSTGSYTVVASRYDNADGAGSYLITLAKSPGGFVVPDGDQGGAMNNGENYSGSLLRGDLDEWSFNATKGDDVTVSISESGTNTAFVPEIHLIGPDGTSYGYGWGDLSAQIHITAGSTGSYTVVASRYDNADGAGNYLLTMARSPATFVVPTGDDGGPMVNGQIYSGTLLRGDLDQWSFYSVIGDAITVTVSESGVNTSFIPKIQLIGPDGTNYGYTWGDVSAQLHITAGATGAYKVIVSRYDSADGVGSYSLSLSAPSSGPSFYYLGLSGSPDVGGTIIASPASSSSYYQTGTKVCLTASPAGGYIFNGWSGTSLDSSGCLILTANVSVTASFLPLTSLRFIPVTPCRVADTRNASGSFGGPAMAAGGTRDFVIPNNPACGIPNTAQAYSLNVTVVPTGKLNYLTAWPTGVSQPLVSTLNSADGRIKANAAIIPAGSDGGVSIYVTDATNVIVDIDGYFVPSSNSAALGFYPVTPCRVADTRYGSGVLGQPSLIAGQARTFPVLSSSCNVPATAQAYSVNVTAVPKADLGYLTLWPTGQGQPNVSTLNAPTGTVTANAAIVPAGSSGAIDVYASDATDLIIDINGYFAPATAGALSLYNVTPCRVLDSRLPAGSTPFSGTISVNASTSPCAVAPSAQALVFNSTAVPPDLLTYLTLWSNGQSQPTVSTLNAFDGAITSNLAIVPSLNGVINAFASNPTYLILDIAGYFAP